MCIQQQRTLTHKLTSEIRLCAEIRGEHGGLHRRGLSAVCRLFTYQSSLSTTEDWDGIRWNASGRNFSNTSIRNIYGSKGANLSFPRIKVKRLVCLFFLMPDICPPRLRNAPSCIEQSGHVWSNLQTHAIFLTQGNEETWWAEQKRERKKVWKHKDDRMHLRAWCGEEMALAFYHCSWCNLKYIPLIWPDCLYLSLWRGTRKSGNCLWKNTLE